MKAVFAVVAVSVLLTEVTALKCYQCTLKDSDANCNSLGPAQCDNSDADTCMTLSAKSGSITTISKLCSLRENCRRASTAAASSTCKAGSQSVSGCVECCQGDACNTLTSFRSDAASATVNAMATVAMATLACILNVIQ